MAKRASMTKRATLAKRAKKRAEQDRKLLNQTIEDLTPLTPMEQMAKAMADDIRVRLSEESPLRKIFPIQEIVESNSMKDPIPKDVFNIEIITKEGKDE